MCPNGPPDLSGGPIRWAWRNEWDIARAYTWWVVNNLNAAVKRGGCFTWKFGATVGWGVHGWARPGNVSKKNSHCRRR